MRLSTRKLLDKAFTGFGFFAIIIMAVALLVILSPILARGSKAFVFRATSEFRRAQLEMFDSGSRSKVDEETKIVNEARKPIYEMMSAFEKELLEMDSSDRRQLKKDYKEFKELLSALIGPMPDEPKAVLPRKRYGQRRWNLAEKKASILLNVTQWVPQEGSDMLVESKVPRKIYFEGTKLEPVFGYIENNLEEILNPKLTFYWRFLTQKSKDSHMFGGIWPELLGTVYLVILTMIFAIPFGVVSAIYLTEYARDTKPIALLRSCISTLAGVPSIVFGLFGLAFIMNVVKIPKSVLAGSLTLAILVLPMIIRASEEAIKSVPIAYKQASLALGATKWHTIFKVVLPASLPGILTGIVISMGRAAGETAPIIFTAAVSVGAALKPWEAIYKPTPALSWNIYNLATEHEEMEAVLHVQYGMVTTLIAVVLLLNLTAIIARAKISKKLKG